MPVNTEMNLMSSYLLILNEHIRFPLIDAGAISEQVWALTTTSLGLTSRVLQGH
jgi:hypothetical protein